MVKRKNKSNHSRLVRSVLLGLASVGLLILALMYGKDLVLFNPKGVIAEGQTMLMLKITAVLLIVAIPTLSLLYYFAWKYRETNVAVKRTTATKRRKFSAFSLWLIPCVTLLILASIMLPATHKLDPHKDIVNGNQPLTIQVIALRSKWLFIYPEQNIASLNFVQIPTDTPVQFELTADEAPMNSFWIPHLGGQLYAMTGHANQLNLMATETGDFDGQAAEINGPGFAGMRFTARASSPTDFETWVQTTKNSPKSLDEAEYAQLIKPSENNPVALYSSTKANLYATVLAKYGGSHGHEGAE